jgi:hypothetical protein
MAGQIMSNKDKLSTILFIAAGALLFVYGVTRSSPIAITIGVCSAVLVPIYYCWKDNEDEGEDEDDLFSRLSTEEFEELKEGLERLEGWVYQEVVKRPVIYDYKYLHRVFKTKEEYRDFLGWVREEASLDGGLPDRI